MQINKVYTNITKYYDLNEKVDQKQFEQQITSASALDNLYNGVFNSIRIFKGFFGLIGAVITEMALFFGIPVFVISIAIYSLFIAFTFAILYLIFRFIPTR